MFFGRGGKATANNRECFNKLSTFARPGTAECVLGEKALGLITEDDIEEFFAQLQNQSRAASTINKYVQLVRAMFRWAVKKGYLARNPVADSEIIKRGKHAKRNRRLTPDVVNRKGKVEREGEERRLLAVAGPHLQRLIVAALESGCRRGELLNLTWADVDLARKEVTVHAEIAKTRTQRIILVSARFAAVLEMAFTTLEANLTAAKGNQVSRDEHQRAAARAYVFGDAIGAKVASIKRAWDTAVLKAHGYRPEWTTSNKLAAASRAALRDINLHFHDLCHEAGSRFVDGGMPVHHVKELLGHANIKTTDTYLNVTKTGLHESMRRFDESALRCNPVATKVTIDPALPCNADSPTVANVLVN